MPTTNTEIHEKVQAMFNSPVYMVGGAVRDELLERPCYDLDFATALLPDDIEASIRAAGRKPYLVGKRFGTIGVKVDGQMVEITTFRGEKYQPGSRKPVVEFVDDLQLDLCRRDFTMNAIASTVDGKYIDPFSGRIDLLQQTIKAVGKPKERFKDDPLRMLRAARFAAQLGFSVDQTTWGHIGRMAPTILNVSRERWMQELDKLLMSLRAGIGLRILADTRLLNFMIPELSLQVGYDQDSPYHSLNLWEHTLAVVELSNSVIEQRWAALLHDAAKPFVRTKAKAGHSNYIDHELLGEQMAIKIGMHLKWSNARMNEVAYLVRHHMDNDSPLREADNKAK